MKLTGNLWKKLAITWGNGSSLSRPRRPRRAELSWDCLEERKFLSHVGLHHHAHHAASALTGSVSTSGSTTSATANTATSSTSSTTDTTTTGTTSTALSTALQTLQNDVQAIEAKSGTTVGQLTAIATTFAALKTDGLTPINGSSSVSTFENNLVTNTTGSTTTPTTTLNDFELLYTTTPGTLTTTQTADLTAAYNALTAAVNSSNITAADITTINTDYAAVLAAQGSTSTATYPYFSLVTGRGGHGGIGGGCH